MSDLPNRATLYEHEGDTPKKRAYRHGKSGSTAEEGLRPLTAAERAVNTVWSWSSALGTFMSPEHPTGIPPE